MPLKVCPLIVESTACGFNSSCLLDSIQGRWPSEDIWWLKIMAKVLRDVFSFKLIGIIKLVTFPGQVFCMAKLPVVIDAHVSWLDKSLIVSNWNVFHLLMMLLGVQNVLLLGVIEMERLPILFSCCGTRTSDVFPRLKSTAHFYGTCLLVSVLLCSQLNRFPFRQELVWAQLMVLKLRLTVCEQLRHLDAFVHGILFFIVRSLISKQVLIRVHIKSLRFTNFHLLSPFKLLLVRILGRSVDTSFRRNLLPDHPYLSSIDNLKELVFGVCWEMKSTADWIFCCRGDWLLYWHLSFAHNSFLGGNSSNSFIAHLLQHVWR